MAIATLDDVRRDIITCERCPRLRDYCRRVAREKRAAYRQDTYWGRPVAGFGDPAARIVLVGLAPAAHGANRTGRNFTGDGVGGSGDFLMAALHANGLANQPTSRASDDGLVLIDTWIMAAVRCAPPDNKPTPGEIATCRAHMASELDALPNARVLVALGRIAFDSCLRLLAARGLKPKRRPLFEHDGVVRIAGGPTIVSSYHPSRQNTHTGRLTPPMLRAVFRTAKRVGGRDLFSTDLAASVPDLPLGTARLSASQVTDYLAERLGVRRHDLQGRPRYSHQDRDRQRRAPRAPQRGAHPCASVLPPESPVERRHDCGIEGDLGQENGRHVDRVADDHQPAGGAQRGDDHGPEVTEVQRCRVTRAAADVSGRAPDLRLDRGAGVLRRSRAAPLASGAGSPASPGSEDGRRRVGRIARNQKVTCIEG